IPEATTNTIPPASARRIATLPVKPAPEPPKATAVPPPPRPAPPPPPRKGGHPVFRLEDIAARRATTAHPGDGAARDIEYPGLLGRVLSGIKGMWQREPGSGSPAFDELEAGKETPQEFAARAALVPAGMQVQTYVNQVSVEQEVPKARAVVAQTSDLLEN